MPNRKARCIASLIAFCALSLCLAGCAVLPGDFWRKRIPLRVPLALILRSEPAVDDPEAEAFARVFEAMGLKPRSIAWTGLEEFSAAREELLIAVPARSGSAVSPAGLLRLIRLLEGGATIVSTGPSSLTEKLGYRPGATIEVSQLQETDFPQVSVQWESPTPITPLSVPEGAAILTRDAATGMPIVSLCRRGKGSALILSAPLDGDPAEGYRRFPFLPQAILKAGVRLPFRAARLSALFDWGYRRQADLEALAQRWRGAGIQAIHAGAWAFYDGNPQQDRYLESLIRACHRNGILVYAWLELPHVTEKFWDEHPEWREKTASGDDAQLDWRSLMNLADPACYAEVEAGMHRMMSRFDWDGANSGEVYFDSPNGPGRPESFTPLNGVVRADYRARSRIDPVEFLNPKSPFFWKRNAREWEKFVDYRVDLERELNEKVLKSLSGMKNASGEPLGLAVTYVDNLYDTKMREAVGADVQGMMPLLEKYDFTLIMEDPGTVWHLGPRRYSELAGRYSKLTPRANRLGIDINIVDRDKTAYPTRKQTGTEFLQLFYNAGKSFETVMVYSEQTIYDWDLALVANALAAGVSAVNEGNEVRLSSPRALVFRSGAKDAEFTVDGKDWPCVSSGDLLLPAGEHRIAAYSGRLRARPRLLDLNGELREASYGGDAVVEFRYHAQPRGIAVFDRLPRGLLVDGAILRSPLADRVMLPGGEHRVRVEF